MKLERLLAVVILADRIPATASLNAVSSRMSRNVNQGLQIQEINVSLLQNEGDWEKPGKGISMDLTGEPKSGTTWTAKLITQLAVHLCGSVTNPWCEMGVLLVIPQIPDPSYVWEMVFVQTKELFLHFNLMDLSMTPSIMNSREGVIIVHKQAYSADLYFHLNLTPPAGLKYKRKYEIVGQSGTKKHPIPGLNVEHNCNPRGREHLNRFGFYYPCNETLQPPQAPSRQGLLDCLPDTSARCAQYMPPADPSVRRMAVVFRDSRDVVLSEYKMRTQVYRKAVLPELNEFIHDRFETIVAWQHQRWIWHTTFYSNVSHIMFYEDIMESFLPLVDLAAFMGLQCAQTQADEVWRAHRNRSSNGNYNDAGLHLNTIQWMNSTMIKLLPVYLATRWGLTVDDSHQMD